MNTHRCPHLHVIAVAMLAIALLPVLAARAAANPVFGFVEDWAGTTTMGWLGGAASGLDIANPGTGGTMGAGDGYLSLVLADDGNFGTRSSGSEYAGDWIAAGIERVAVALNDVGNPDAFEIHLCIGNGSNFWQYNEGFVPPSNEWAEFSVDLTNASKFTRIIGSGTFEDALHFADRILIRHDRAPFVQAPDPTHGDLGIDRVVMTANGLPTRTISWGSIKQRYR